MVLVPPLSARVHQRYRVIEEVRKGHSVVEAADRVGCHFTVAYDWVHRFNQSGFVVNLTMHVSLVVVRRVPGADVATSTATGGGAGRFGELRADGGDSVEKVPETMSSKPDQPCA
jgi:hypothetical protein